MIALKYVFADDSNICSFSIHIGAEEENIDQKVISLDEAMEQGLVQDFIEKPEQTAYTADDVLFEYTDLRTDETKSFRLSNGNTLAIDYGYPVHYLDAEGDYQDIDNRLMLYNPDGSLSTEEPDSILNAWLEEQAEIAAREEQEEKDPVIEEPTEEQTPPGEEPPGDETPAEETPPESETPSDGEEPPEGESENDNSSEEETPHEGEETDQDSQSEGTSEETNPPGEMEEEGSGEPETEGADVAEETAEENPDDESVLVEERASEQETIPPEESGLGDIPEDLPAKVPGPPDPRYYRNNSGLADVTFGVLSNADRLVQFTFGIYSVSFTPQVLVPAAKQGEIIGPSAGRVDEVDETRWNDGSLDSVIIPRNINSSLTYRNVFEQADLQYVLCETALKENIVIHAQASNYVYTFQLETEGLTPQLNDRGYVEFVDAEGECVLLIPPGLMYDASGEISEKVYYELWKRGNSTFLSVIADSSWINAEERQFPVVVDPTVKINWDPSIEISTVSSGSPDTSHDYLPYPTGLNYSPSAMGYVGMHPNAGLRKLRTLIHVGTLPPIPANSTIVGSYLKLYLFRYYWYELLPMVVEAHALTSNQEVNGSWCKYHTWNDSEGLLSSYVLNYYRLKNDLQDYDSKYFYVDVTREAIGWYNDPTTNYGICLKAINESTMTNGYYGYALIPSIDVTYATIQRPYFIVEYRNTAGIESYFSYQTQDVGRAGAAFVGDYTGQVTLVKTDAGAASTVNPASVSHVYNTAYSSGEYCDAIPGCSNIYSNMILGAGWKLDVQQSITVYDNDYLMYVDGDGTLHYFKKVGNVYRDEDGMNLTITVSGTNYTLTDELGNTSFFENGVLSYSQDTSGNRVNIVRNALGQITSVTKTNNGGNTETVATLSYDESGVLTSITNSAGKTTSYTYDVDGRLTTVTHPDGTTASYTYDTDNRLLSAADNETGYAVHYEYHPGTGKIQRFYETAGVTTGAQVSVDGTQQGVQVYRSSGADMQFGNADDLLTTCVFDYWGRTINSSTTSVDRKTVYGASAGKYSANTGTSKGNNRLLVASATGIQNPNLLADPGAEGMSAISSSSTPWTVTGTGSIETGTVRTGRKAIKLSGDGSVHQTLTGLQVNGWYVLSAYVNTGGVSSFGTSGGVYMASGNVHGEPIRWDTSGVGDGWERIYVVAQADANGSLAVDACASGIQGSVIFDDFQVESSAFGAHGTPGAASLLYNGAMERTDGWSVWITGHHTVGAEGGLSGKGLEINGIIGECIDVYQTVPINQPGTQTYLLSGWAKGDSVPLEAPPELGLRFFCFAVYISYTDGSSEFQKCDFNPQTTEWQYLSFPVVPQHPEKTVDSIMVLISFGRNPNTVFFDNLSLTREEAQTYKYDSEGHLTSVATPGNNTQSYTYSGADLISQVTKGNGTYSYTYDNRHNVTRISNDGLNMSVTYDSRGNASGTNLTGTGTNLQISSSAAYDAGGDRLVSQTDARDNSVSYQYETDYSKMVGSPTKVTDPRGVSSTTAFNENSGRTTSVSVLDGTDTEASIAYTYSNGLPTVMTRTAYLPDGSSFTQSYGMSYNAFGQNTGLSVGNITLATYSYAANGGLLQSMTYGNGDSVAYSYDALARVENVYYNGDIDPALTYDYAANGGLGSLTDYENDRRYVYSYDGLDRLISMTETFGGDAVQVFHADYDDANRVSATEYRVSPTWDGELGQTRSYGYTYSGTNGSLSGMTMPGGGAYSYQYDGLRRLDTRTLTRNNSAFLTRSYGYVAGSGANDTTMLVGSLTNSTGSGSPLNSWTYSYDAAGHITSISDGTEVWSYTYDAQGQLLTETLENGDDVEVWTYTYDTGGNLRSVSHEFPNNIGPGGWTPLDPIPTPEPSIRPTGLGGSQEGEPESVEQDTIIFTWDYSYNNAQWPDLLTAYNGDPITYDAIGNPTEWYDGTEFTWVKGRRLESAARDGLSVSYGYDSSGLRLYKEVNRNNSYEEHFYVWQGSRIISERCNDTELEFFYDEAGQPYALLVRDTSAATPTEAWYYYVTNLQGDVVMLLDSSGTVVAEYSYNAWGLPLSATGTMAELNPIRYRGYYYDAETGFYYLQSRYYDPVICRFLNADGYASTGQGVLGCNMFAYCGNDAVGRSDPGGSNWLNFPLVVSVFEQIIENLQNLQNVSVGSAPDYIYIGPSNGDRSTQPNCYSYAIGEYEKSYDPGDFSFPLMGFSANAVANAIERDMHARNRGCRRIDSFDSPISPNEYRIAIRVKDPPLRDTPIGLVFDWDYHVMVQTSSGLWAEKHGSKGETVLYLIGNPSTISWDLGDEKGYYTSEIIYLAITKKRE